MYNNKNYAKMESIYLLECICKNGNIHISNIAYKKHKNALEMAELLKDNETIVIVKEIFIK